MAGIDGGESGSDARHLTLEGTILRAALLARYGREARGLARRLTAATDAGGARSCLEAGAPVQLTVDAPGPLGLRVGVRLGDRLDPGSLGGLVGEAPLRYIAGFLAPMPTASHPSIGTRLFWTEARQSVFVDLRDPDPNQAFARLHTVLDRGQRERLEAVGLGTSDARPWALRVEADDSGLRRLHLYWLVGRHTSPAAVADAVAPGRWGRATEVLGHLLTRPGVSGRWLIATPLDDRSRPALRIGSSGWTLVPEDERKHRAVGQLMEALNGPRDHAEALWSLCRGGADPGWRVGRACEVRVGDEETRARLFFTPQIQPGATAGTNSSLSLDSLTSPDAADPLRAKRTTR